MQKDSGKRICYFRFPSYFCGINTNTMENNGKQKYEIKLHKGWFLGGLLSSAVCILMIIYLSTFFWVALPFVFMCLAKSIDAL